MDVQRETDAVLGELANMVLGITDVSDRDQAVDAIERALDGWCVRLRGASYYAAQDDMPLTEVAERVGRHYDTVRSAVRRFRLFTGRPMHPRVRRDRYAGVGSTVPLVERLAAGPSGSSSRRS